MANRLSIERRAQILSCLVEGNSIRATSRLTGAAKNTVTKLLCDVGEACWEYQDRVLVDLPCQRVQCDEIWSFVYAKARNVPEAKKGQFGIGDIWTWVALCADSKLAINWAVGNRDANTATAFMYDLAARLANRVQLTTDGHLAYVPAVGEAFNEEIDYAQLVKIYGTPPEGEIRYSPPECVGARKWAAMGNPNKRHVSTSYVERQNLTMRMSMRRFTRLTNAFSKKVENLMHAVSLHFMHYNFVRLHQSLEITPAMAAGVTNRLWELSDIAKLPDQISN